MATRELTPKQQRFVEEYLIDLNGTRAAIRAGYSAKTANQQAARLLANVNVQAAVSVARKEQSDKAKIDAGYVLDRLRREAEFTGEGASHSARVQALTQLGKHLGMFVERHEVKTSTRLVVEEEVVGGDDPADGPAAPGPA